MPDDYGDINIRWLITNSILRAETRLAETGHAERELAALAALLKSWLPEKDRFWREVQELEEETVRLHDSADNGGIALRVVVEEGQEAVKVYMAQWPRMALPNWQLRYFSLCVGAAKRHNLLDWERRRFR